MDYSDTNGLDVDVGSDVDRRFSFFNKDGWEVISLCDPAGELDCEKEDFQKEFKVTN